jgi:hypothetical protein
MANLGQLLLRLLEHQAMGTLRMVDLCPPMEGDPADQCHRMQTRTKASLPPVEGNSHLCTEIKIHRLTIRPSLPLTLALDQAHIIIKVQASIHSQQCRLTITITPLRISSSLVDQDPILLHIVIHPPLHMGLGALHLPWG